MFHTVLKDASRIAVVSIAIVLAVGCSNTKVPTPATAETSPQVGVAPAQVMAVIHPYVPPTVVHPLDDPKSALAKRAIYFDFDSFVLTPASAATLEAHGNYLRAQPNAKVMLRGNTDERGGREFNLGLGQLRAESVLKSLRLLGASDSQLEAISFGEEMPNELGHDEASWAENRRVDIVYTTR